MAIHINYQESEVLFNEDDTHATPPSGQIALYGKTDGFLYSKDDAGVETQVSGGGGGTPGGANTEIQFNDSGSFGGDPDFTYANATGRFFVNTTTGSSGSVTSATPGTVGILVLEIQVRVLVAM